MNLRGPRELDISHLNSDSWFWEVTEKREMTEKWKKCIISSILEDKAFKVAEWYQKGKNI